VSRQRADSLSLHGGHLDLSSPTARKARSKIKPIWDAELHELRFKGHVVKRFKGPAKSQELILAAFQEDGWPDVIDDPLPMLPGQDPKRRLHYTVHHLNRVQRPCLIHFFVNGGGQRIYWQPVIDRQVSSARRARSRS
jgi:hypothetical protein